MSTRRRLGAVVVVFAVAAVACSSDGADDGVMRIYTSVTQDTVDAVVAGFETAHPDVTVEVFRAPTGELTARIAAEQRDGDVQADVLWLTDPLSIQQYARDGILKTWTPADVDAVPEDYRTDSFFGTRVLNMIIVTEEGASGGIDDWDDLFGVSGDVAIPDPGFAGSAFGALAFFATHPNFGMSFYESLRGGGGVQVRSPGDVVSGVAEGVYGAGMTLDRSARAAIEDGSPLEMIWPSSGAIAIYSPIAVVDAAGTEPAEAFVEYVLSEEAQMAIASTGWQPIRSDVGWDQSGAQQSVDWGEAFERQDELLAEYRAIFAG